ncbi:MAG: hypothetical protein H7274_17550 [Rhodoferax sp.]|nr:hypothetical protein [Rhodoferax sp.]
MSGTIHDNFLADRADQLHLMAANVFMRQHGEMSGEELAAFLDGAAIQGEVKRGACDLLFGFDVCGQDFMVIKQPEAEGPHLVFLAEGEPQ